MKPMLDLMVDVETLSTTPSACIVSIGAVLFDRHTPGRLGEEFYARVQIDASKGDVDADTIEWWMRHAAAWPPPEGALPLNVALCEIAHFITKHTPGVGYAILPPQPDQPRPVLTLWGHGADFDPPILHSAYHACGLARPWGKGQVRDTRTLFELAGCRYSTEGRETPGHHHALEDAKACALAVQRAWAVLAERERLLDETAELKRKHAQRADEAEAEVARLRGSLRDLSRTFVAAAERDFVRGTAEGRGSCGAFSNAARCCTQLADGGGQ